MTEDATPFQTVRYPAAGELVVEFRLPADWKADPNLPGMGLFYPESEVGGPWPVGGMLAVNIDARSFSPPLTADDADAQVRANSKDPGQVLRLGPERWVIRGKNYKQELSHRSVVHVWVLVRLVRPDLLARIGFVFSAVDSFYDEPGDLHYGVVDMLEREIEAARVVEG